MNLEEKKARIDVLEKSLGSIYEEKFRLEREVNEAETQNWYETGVPATVKWKLNVDREKAIEKGILHFSGVDIPDEYWSVFGSFHGSVTFNEITFVSDDNDAFMYGPAERVREFCEKFDVEIDFKGIMGLISQTSEGLLNLKKLYCSVKGINFDDIQWPKS